MYRISRNNVFVLTKGNFVPTKGQFVLFILASVFLMNALFMYTGNSA